MTLTVGIVSAQKAGKTTAYAITAVQKGGSNWTEVRLVDVNSGDEVKSIYQSAQDVQAFNARTGKPIVKKETTKLDQPAVVEYRTTEPVMVRGQRFESVRDGKLEPTVKDQNDANIVITPNMNVRTMVRTELRTDVKTNVRTVIVRSVNDRMPLDRPFSTSSAALAYDKKHERLYYTPMGINQLRYIDLKSNQVYYFEDEPFGALKGRGDVPNQITRMVIAADGNGYAITNDGNHLIQFTTSKKPVITDLGPLSDDAVNGAYSVHNSNGYGGDMIADAKNNLYLITANRSVFKISMDTKVATLLGVIKGLPRGFSTNGAMVEGGSKVIVCSSTSTEGYYRFDLNTLQAEKISAEGSVFNASDLANGILAFDKEKKKKEIRPEPEQAPEVKTEAPAVVDAEKAKPAEVLEQANGNISVYPNPVTNSLVRLSFANQPKGKYQVQFMDISGKIISVKDVTLNSKSQVEELSLPEGIAKGSYLVRVVNAANKVSMVNKLIVE